MQHRKQSARLVGRRKSLTNLKEGTRAYRVGSCCIYPALILTDFFPIIIMQTEKSKEQKSRSFFSHRLSPDKMAVSPEALNVFLVFSSPDTGQNALRLCTYIRNIFITL